MNERSDFDRKDPGLFSIANDAYNRIFKKREKYLKTIIF